ncbi:MAG TPA: IMP dehydrogenase [Candidatus Paceibacterota bacterium]
MIDGGGVIIGGLTKNLSRFRGKTFRDVLLPPLGENIAGSRSGVALDTKFSVNVALKQPLVSANMLDVTESKMAIKMALEGGLGVIHRFIPPDQQADQVASAKRAHNFLIENPICIGYKDSVGAARNIMEQHGIGSLLVLDFNGKLDGILTQRDIRFVPEKDCVSAHMTKRIYVPGYDRGNLIVSNLQEVSSAADIIQKLIRHKIKKLPVVDSNNYVRGLISAKDIERLGQYPLANLDSKGNLIVGAAIGAVGDYIERAQELKKRNVDVIVMDVTSANSSSVKNAIREFRRRLGNYELVIGNIGSSEQAHALMREDVQGLKIGIGPGGPCTTRLATGIGVPQLFAILEIYWNLYISNHMNEEIPPLCADGNIRSGVDVVHALLAGASSVMLGTVFAGTEETPGKDYDKPDGRYKLYRGMASQEAAIERFTAAGFDDPVAEAIKKSPEGIPTEVKVKGSVSRVISDLLGGVRAGISHRGVLSLEDLKKQNPFDEQTGFQILSDAARAESYDR